MPAQCANISAMRPGQLSVLVCIVRLLPLVQIGAASAIIDLRMMSACSAWSPPVISISASRREFRRPAAALPAPILEGLERDGDVCRAIDLLRENNGVFDADAGARREMGRRRMHSVADQDHAPDRPWPGSNSVSEADRRCANLR